MPEHGTQVPQASGTVIQQIVFDAGAHHRSGVLGTQGQLLAIECIGKGVHLLLDDVCHLADTANEQGGGFHNRGSYGCVAIGPKHISDLLFNRLPNGRLRRQQVIHSLYTNNFVHALLWS